MKKKIYVKNMVCDRCITTLKNAFENLGIKIDSITLGEIAFHIHTETDIKVIEDVIHKNGFEIIKDDAQQIVEAIKVVLLSLLKEEKEDSLSSNVSKKLHKDYSSLSKLFSKSEGITIEKYFINLKIEKAKELIQMNQSNFSEIAYSLNYKSSSHLASQFKTVTGMSMSDYKELKNWDRKPLDQIL